MKISEIVEYLSRLEVNDKYLIYICLLEDVKRSEKQLVEQFKNVHSLDYLKNLLNMKKETAIENLANLLPLLRAKNLEGKHLILKIIPVLFSYVTLYDAQVNRIFEIIDKIRLLPAFQPDQSLFDQWFHVFDRRRRNSKRKFSYKDEYYVQELPTPSMNHKSGFAACIGYADIALLRTVHRWLRVLRLHKYLYFFANLTYNDILSIDETNIKHYEMKVGVFDMTIGARNKILREIEDLKSRPARLRSIIKRQYLDYSDLEAGAREIKKIMRSPISVTECSPHLPNLLVKAMKRVCDGVMALVGSGEKIIPLYGLMISILKEAYNYSFFDAEHKENFNTWRSQLSAKINKNVMKPNTSSILMPIIVERHRLDSLDSHDEDFSGSMSTMEESTALIAAQMANFVLS